MVMEYINFLGQIVLALALGGIVGWQRHKIGAAAGMRTFALVSAGAALFTLLSVDAFSSDPGRVAGPIITGIGFLGAGTIIHKSGGIEGLTTAAGLWAVAAIGMAIGVGWYGQAVIATGLVFLTLMSKRRK